MFGVLLFLVGGAPRALATGDPTPGTTYGCVVGSTRTLEDVYTTPSGFSTFLQANAGTCPSGFVVGIGKQNSANTAYPDLPSTGPVYGCVESGRTLEDVYEGLSGFQALLAANGGACPSGGFIVFIGPSNSMPAESPIPAEAPVWACAVGRTLEDVYQNESSYDTWLAGEGGTCPGSGFQVTAGYNYSCTQKEVGNTDNFATCPASSSYSDLSVPSGSKETVSMDDWDATGCHPSDTCAQWLDANNDSDWQFTANTVNDPPSSYVITYPDQETIFPAISPGVYEPALEYNEFTGGWNQIDPPLSSSTDWESAYDIWYGGYAGGTPGTGDAGYEIMIWTVNNNDTPAGTLQSGVTCSDGESGGTWNVYETAKTDGYPDTVTLVPASSNTIGNSANSALNFTPLFECLNGGGLINQAAMGVPGTGTWSGDITGLYEMDYGWEVQNTDNAPLTFTMDQYYLTVSND
jgi:hypothetical protein